MCCKTVKTDKQKAKHINLLTLSDCLKNTTSFLERFQTGRPSLKSNFEEDEHAALVE